MLLRVIPLCLGALLWASALHAQIDLGGFFAFGGTVATVNESAAVLPGVGAGLVLNGRWIVGAEIAGLIPTIRADSTGANGTTLFVEMFTVGGGLEYVHNPEDFFQYGGRIHIARASVGFGHGSRDHGRSDTTSQPTYGAGMLQPELSGCLAFNENFRVRIGAGWRMVLGRESGSEPAGDLSGPVASLAFRIGMFGDR